jgi:hypothetical protein
MLFFILKNQLLELGCGSSGGELAGALSSISSIKEKKSIIGAFL